MKNKQIILLLLLTPLFMNLKCKKEETPEGYFFMCKLDGKEYRASGGLCVNCIAGFLKNDTTVLISGKRSNEDIGLGINDSQGIKEKTYILNNLIGRQGMYDNSITINDSYLTDSIRTGELIITRLDKVKKEIEGTFYFRAYSPTYDKIVNITEGKFRINYRD
jgi:Family of unknown function (DUF6252)